ncbi:MAG: polysaccharide deacetylase family protein [Proteobacteria bacterium]|nr:MAG: polysaccharide deacetylase family protein [Pseudomonadota bacterium]
MHALTVDLEEYFHVSNFEGRIARGRWDALPSRVQEPTARLLDLFDAHGATATFFALGWIAERQPRLLREIAARGHEIACHGHAHELVYELGPERFRADLRRARAAIEDAVGATPLGYRAPSYSITQRSLWALPILAEEGFLYDSSIFPVRHPRYGIPGFPPGLVAIQLGGGTAILELPPTTASIGGMQLPVAGGAYLRLLPMSVFRWGFRRAARQRPPAVLIVHPWELDADQPRLRVPWSVGVRHYRNLDRTEERLAELLRGMEFDSMLRVLERAAAAGGIPARPLGDLVAESESDSDAVAAAAPAPVAPMARAEEAR